MHTDDVALADLLWAKTDNPRATAQHQPRRWVSLRHHLSDTGLVAGHLFDHFMPPRATTSVTTVDGSVLDRDTARAFIVLSGAAHDVGKGTPGFQARVSALADRIADAGLWRTPDAEDEGYEHANLSAALVLRWARVRGISSEAAVALASVVGGHHGSWPDHHYITRGKAGGIADELELDDEHPQWFDAACRLLDDAMSLAGLEPRDLPAVSASWQVALSGLLTLADWAASAYAHYYSIERDAPDLSHDAVEARARRIVSTLALTDTWTPPHVEADDLSTVLREQFGVGADSAIHAPATWVQTAVVEATRTGDAALVLVESRPGSGKTEAAMLGCSMLANAGRANGIAFLLPTRATTKQAADRVFRWTRRTAASTAVVGAAMTYSRSWMTDTVRSLEPAGPDRWGAKDDTHEERTTSGLVDHRWLNGRTAVFTDVWVATIDHLLAMASPRKHIDITHAAITRKVVVIDEVHSCDPVMHTHLLKVLGWLGRHKVPVIAMSATISGDLRESLVRAYTGNPGAVVPDEPAVARVTTVRTDGSMHQEVVERTRSRSIKVQWHEDDNVELASTLDEALTGGGCALVFRSTVDAARETYDALRRHGGLGEVVLAHSRLTEADRAAADTKLLDMLGNPYRVGTVRPDKAVIVATQVAEQSLDLDADIMVSDVVPIDSMWQRLGRLHRHPSRVRPAALRRPRVLLLGDPRQDLAFPVRNKGVEAVYGEALLIRTHAWLAQRRVLLEPLHIDRSIRAVYGLGRTGPTAWRHATAYGAAAHRSAMHNAVRNTAWRTVGVPDVDHPSMMGTQIRGDVGFEDLETAVRDGALEHEMSVLVVGPDERLYPPVQALVDLFTGEPDVVLPMPLDRADATLEEVAQTFVKVPTERFGIDPGEVRAMASRPYWPSGGALSRVPVLLMRWDHHNATFVGEVEGRRFRYSPGRGMSWRALAGDRTAVGD